jgi:branched-chain amino acid transport system substrate-binding protein
MRSRLFSRRRVLGGACAAGAAFVLGCKMGCNSSSSGGAGGGAAPTGGGNPSGGNRPLKVGVVMTLSGLQGGLGKELDQGLTLALERGGMQGGGRTIELLKRDDKNDAQVGADLAKQLIESDKVDLIVGPSHSHVILAMRNVIHDSKTILINPNAGAALLAGALCSPYIINTSRVNPFYPESMGRYLAKKGVKNVVVLASNFAAGLDIVEGFKATFVGEGGGKVVSEILPALSVTDYAPHIKEASAAKADAAFAFFAGEQAVNFVRQYAQAGLKTKLPLYTTGYTVEQDVLPAEGDAALGILSTACYAPFLDNEANKTFAPAYKGKYGVLPSEYAVVAYDAGQLLLAALGMTGGKVDNKDAFMNALMTAKIDSPRGPFRMGPNHTPIQNAYLREVVNSGGQLANNVVAVAWADYYYPGEGCTLPGVKQP